MRNELVSPAVVSLLAVSRPPADCPFLMPVAYRLKKDFKMNRHRKNITQRCHSFKFMKEKAFIILVVFFSVTGCASVYQDYRKPELTLSDRWSHPLASSPTTSLDGESPATWWTKLNDPVLSSLVNRTVLGNLDLREAKAHVREARAQLNPIDALRYE